MNKMKSEDVMMSCDKAQPNDEHSVLREYRRRIHESVNYRGTNDHDDVITILLEYKKVLLREKDAEIERLKKASKNLSDLGNGWIVTGYKNIRAEAITEFAERLKTFYRHLKGNTASGSVEYHIEQIKKELLGREPQ